MVQHKDHVVLLADWYDMYALKDCFENSDFRAFRRSNIPWNLFLVYVRGPMQKI